MRRGATRTGALLLGLTILFPAAEMAGMPLPLVFESNRGQTDPRVRFIARTQGSSLFLLDDGGAVLSLPADGDGQHAVRMSLEGGQPLPVSQGIGDHGKANYYRGNDPKRWLAGVPTWDRAQYTAVYPGIDLVYYANDDKRLEFDFVVAPGADPAQILLRFEGLKAKEGEKNLAVDGEGRLRLATPAGEVAFDAPRVYQDVDGERRTVEGRYQLADAGKVRFALGAYDASRPLVIDPVMVYSSYLGGSLWETVEELAVDSQGNSVFVGYTFSPDFPLVNPFLSTLPGGWDLHVTKVNATGSQIVYSSYLGSGPSPPYTGTEWPGGIAVDAAGNAYVSGLTQGANFPIVNAVQPVSGGAADIFVTKLSPAGEILYSTYLGGNANDFPSWLWPSNIAVMPDGKAYVVGLTFSTDYPQVNGAQTSLSADTSLCVAFETFPCTDLVLTVLSPAGDQILYSTFWGGPYEETGTAVAVDSTGAAYLLAFGAPHTPLVNPFKPEFETGDMFLMKIRPDGSPPVYATFVGADPYSGNLDLAVDGEGAAYMMVQSRDAADLPVPHAIQPVHNWADWYLAKINPRGTGIEFATYFGGPGFDNPWDLDVDAMGNMVISGYALYQPFPVLNSLFPGIVQDDGFVVRIHPTGPTLLYSTALDSGWTGSGGNPRGIAFGPRGDVYVGGATSKVDLALVNPLQSTYAGGDADIFLRRLADGFATLSTPSRIPAQAGDTVNVPVRFTPGGANISAAALSVDFDEACLTYNPASPVVFTVPAGYTTSASYNAADTDGEIDITLFDLAPPIVPLPLGEVARIPFQVKPACGGTDVSTLARVGFSTAPSVSFGANGQSVPGISLDGSVEVFGGLRGDCNADLLVDAGDLDAEVLELSDTDGSFWLDARLSTFLGSPVGCDANADAAIDAGDLSCAILLIFEGPEACSAEPLLPAQASLDPPALEIPALVRPGRDGNIRVPVTLFPGGHPVSSLAFSLVIPDTGSFDPTDADLDGIPDAVTLQLPAGFAGRVRWNPKNSTGQLSFFVFDITGSRQSLPPDEALAVVTLTSGPHGVEPLRFGTAPAASFGLSGGRSVEGVARTGE